MPHLLRRCLAYTLALLCAGVTSIAARDYNDCSACHKAAIRRYKSAQFVHDPIAEDECGECHLEHGLKNQLILTDTANNLCRKCMDLETPEFLKAHQVPAADADCTQCHDSHSSETSRNYIKPNLHKPFAEGKCFDCHDPNIVGKIGFVVPASELCIKCHSNRAATGTEPHSLHLPVLLGNCTRCHQTHASKNEHLLDYERDSIAVLCTQCHMSIDNHSNLHTPVKEGDCLACHNPHKSANDKLLISPRGQPYVSISEVCYRCHQNKADLPNVHLIVLAGECLACHDVHGSDYPNNLIAPPEKLCLEPCHSSAAIKTGLVVHAPVAKGNCIGCHDPHQSRNTKLIKISDGRRTIRISQLCFDNCHRMFIAKVGMHKPVQEGSCESCHNMHSGPNRKLLLAKGNKLCFICHKLLENGGKVHKSNREQNCISCHDPHYPRQ